jgi:hypothetical protein
MGESKGVKPMEASIFLAALAAVAFVGATVSYLAAPPRMRLRRRGSSD